MLFLYPILTFSAMYKYTDARQHRTLYAIVTFVYLLIVLFFGFVSTVASYSCTIYIFYTFGTHPATLSRMQLTERDYLDRTLSHYHFDRIPVHHKSSVHSIRRLAAQLT